MVPLIFLKRFKRCHNRVSRDFSSENLMTWVLGESLKFPRLSLSFYNRYYLFLNVKIVSHYVTTNTFNRASPALAVNSCKLTLLLFIIPQWRKYRVRGANTAATAKCRRAGDSLVNPSTLNEIIACWSGTHFANVVVFYLASQMFTSVSLPVTQSQPFIVKYSSLL